jgi:hypothetical protein
MFVAGSTRNLGQRNGSPPEQPSSAEDLLQSKKSAEFSSCELTETPAENQRVHPQLSSQLADLWRATGHKTARQVMRDLGLDVASESHSAGSYQISFSTYGGALAAQYSPGHITNPGSAAHWRSS